jgi:hypothetical protein
MHVHMVRSVVVCVLAGIFACGSPDSGREPERIETKPLDAGADTSATSKTDDEPVVCPGALVYCVANGPGLKGCQSSCANCASGSVDFDRVCTQ